MNAGTAMFILSTMIHERVHFARRSGGTKGNGVRCVWNAYARNASLFTYDEVQVIKQRYPGDVKELLAGTTQNPDGIIDGQERKAS